MRTLHFIACFFLLLLGIAGVACAGQLESFFVREQGKSISILCAFSGTFTHHAFTLPSPNRVVLDFGQTNTHLNLARVAFNRTTLTRLRTGHPTPQTLRIVFDVNQIFTIKTSNWQPVNRNFRGLKIDLISANTSANASVVKSPSVKYVAHQNVVHKPSPHSLRDVVVVIDPGHGGKDPGAIGKGRSAEKQVVLAIALKLKQLIDRQPGMRAVLTRNGDYYIGLRERMYIARKDNADIFVAIHADAFNNPDSNGASVFALSARGATSEAARWLAEKENYSELGGVNLRGLDDANGVIRTVLIDLSQTATIGASLQMGSQVLRQLDTITRLHNAKVEQARFMVLKSPDIPSILIETGFISNPREERNLTNPAYQTRLTQAIFNGIKAYFWDYPPHGTRVEAMAGSRFTKQSFHASVS
jgi:N-acetylmuramoyl-L-alanine amidase